MKKLFLVLLFVFICRLCFAQNEREQKWQTDIDYLKTQLPEKHIHLFGIKSKEYFNSSLDAIKAQTKDLSDFEIAVKLQQVIASMGDSHTGISLRLLDKQSKALPLGLFWFKDGIYILQADPENENLLGTELTGINNVHIKTVIDSLSTLITVDNIGMLKKEMPHMLTNYSLLQYFHYADSNKVYLNVRSTKDSIRQVITVPDTPFMYRNLPILKRDTTPLFSINRDKLFAEQYLPADKIYYIQYNQCWSKELEKKYGNKKKADTLPSFADFEKRILNVIKKENITKLIFDIRFNQGGGSLQGTELISKLYNNEKVKKMKVYVLVGRYTFSSAIINAMDFKRFPNVTYVGDETSGKPNHYGEIKQLKLPESGLVVYYSTKHFTRWREGLSTIEPDVKTPSGIDDYRKGIDPAYEWIKSQ